MLLRYERQLKAEILARQKAEHGLAAALAATAASRQQSDSYGRQAMRDTASLAAEQEAMQQERAMLDHLRADFERQLQTARAELVKAQTSTAHKEERARAAEVADRSLLIADYEAQLATHASEINALREELDQRTSIMQAEMDRWKHQADITASAVIEAKNEVLERKRELDSTKDKMDRLIDKLYAGREANVSLAGAIAAASYHHQASRNSLLGSSSMGGAAAAAGHRAQHRSTAAKVPSSNLSSSVAPSQFFLESSAGNAADTHGSNKATRRAGGSYSRPAAEVKAPGPLTKTKAKAAQQKKQRMPDRFAESAKSAAMIAAMASRW
eukprot:gene11361-11510_t